MVDPYDFVPSPTIKSSRKKKKKKTTTMTNKSRRVSIQRPAVSNNNIGQMRTRSSLRAGIGTHEKENNSNNGFTQLVETKMMDAKTRQDRRIISKTSPMATIDESSSPSVIRKRQRSDNEDGSTMITSSSSEKEPEVNNNLIIDEHDDGSKVPLPTKTTTICLARHDLKDQYLLLPANKRRRPCLCSKKQLDELEFATDSAPSQQTQEEQQIEEENNPRPDTTLTNVDSSPSPPLLHLSPLMPPSNLTFTLQNTEPMVRHTEEEDNEEENRFRLPATVAAPLSPAMPLNSTYMTRRSVLTAPPTQLPSTLLGISTLLVSCTTTAAAPDETSNSTSCVGQIANLEQTNPIDLSVASIEPPTDHHPVPSIIQPTRCSTSTQTNDDYPIHDHHHHPCSDVSECPCVRIYTRSEQLFMASMATLFRHSFSVTPPEPPPTTITTARKLSNKQPRLNPPVTPALPPSTAEINSISPPPQNETTTTVQKNDVVPTNETFAVDHPIEFPAPPPEPEQLPLDTSTVITETHVEKSKADGSSIQIDMHTRGEETNDLPVGEASIDRDRFQSLVLAMTGLKDEQKIEFNRFLEQFSVRSSVSIDETTTHLITDEDENNSLICPLTGKVLQAVARHLTIVSYRWIRTCLFEQHYVEEIPTFEIVGDSIFDSHHGMSRSRLLNNNRRLFAHHAFHIKCHGCQPFVDNRPLIELIHLTGGMILKTLNQHVNNIGREIVILCSKNYLLNKPALQQACQKLHIHCVEPEWLIASVIKFDVQSYEPWKCHLFDM